jgi:hypothetical protein
MPFDEDPQLGAAAAGRHESGGSRQTQCAGTRDDQHGQARAERVLRGAPGDQPAGQGENRGRQHQRDEDTGDPVGQPLDSGFLGLRPVHQPDQMGQLSIGSDLDGLDDQAAGEGDGACADGVARDSLHRNRFTGHRAAVHGRLAEQHLAVRGDLLPRPHHEGFPSFQHADGDAPLGAVVAEHADIFRGGRREFAHRFACRVAGTGLVEPPGEQERGHRRRHLKVDAAARGVREFLECAHSRPAVEAEHRVHRPSAGGSDPERHERVHRARAVPRVLDRRAVERPRGPQRHRRREAYQHPLPPGEPVGGEQRQQDGQVAERDEENERDSESPAQVPDLVVALSRRCLCAPGGHDLRRIPGVLNRRDQRQVRYGLRDGNGRPFRRVAHRGGDLPVDHVELLLDPRCARRAGHPAYRQLDRPPGGRLAGE